MLSAVAMGLIAILMTFLLAVLPTGILQVTFSLFGAIGGPILTIFTLGILVPLVNKWVRNVNN